MKNNFDLGFSILDRVFSRVKTDKHIKKVEITANCNCGGIRNYSIYCDESGISLDTKFCEHEDCSDKAVRFMHYIHAMIKQDRYTGPVKLGLECSGGVVVDSYVVEERR